MKYLVILFFIMYPYLSTATEINFEIGQTRTINNYFQIPNNNQNRIDLPSSNQISFRIKSHIDISNKYFLYLLFAPLRTEYQFNSNRSFDFDGRSFLSNTNTTVNYKFNSYRAGLMRNWQYKTIKIWGGIVLKIRDAHIQVSQSNQSHRYSNIGLVPLLSLGANIKLSHLFSVFTHTDALGASQGYAYDSQIELRYKLKSHTKNAISLGYRVLGGGADNDKLKNFAQFNTVYMAYSYNF